MHINFNKITFPLTTKPKIFWGGMKCGKQYSRKQFQQIVKLVSKTKQKWKA